MIYIKLLLILIILTVLLYLSNLLSVNKEPFQTAEERIFNIYSLFSNNNELNCDLTRYIFPKENSENQHNYFKFLLDNNFTLFKELTHITFEHQQIKHLHKQTLNELPKLNYVSFHGNQINMISGDILINNLGNPNNQGGNNRKFVISLPDNDKLSIICYENIFERLKNLNLDEYDLLANINFSNVELSERLIYNFLYNNVRTETPTYLRKLIARVLGVGEALINSNSPNFTLCRKNDRGDVIEIPDNELISKIKLVYYKDILFTTDLAHWRINVFNSITIPMSRQTSNEMRFITRYGLYSSFTLEDGSLQNEYLSILHIMLEIIETNERINVLNNLLSIHTGDTENEEYNREITLKRRRITHLVNLMDNININNYDIPANILQYFNINYINQCNLISNCESIRPSRNSNGEIIIPDYARELQPPNFNTNHDFLTIDDCQGSFNLPNRRSSVPNTLDNCPCNLYVLDFESENGLMQQTTLLSQIDPTIDTFYSLHHIDEEFRHKHLTDIIRLFTLSNNNVYVTNMIEFANLFMAIPVQGNYYTSS